MDEYDLKDTTAYLRSEFPAPSEAYSFIAEALEALWAQNKELREQVELLQKSLHHSTYRP